MCRAWKRTDRAPPLLLFYIYLTGNKPHKLRETRNPIAHQVKEAMKVHQAIYWSQPLGDSGRSFLVSSIPTQAGKESISFDASFSRRFPQLPAIGDWTFNLASFLLNTNKPLVGGIKRIRSMAFIVSILHFAYWISVTSRVAGIFILVSTYIIMNEVC